MTRIKRNGKVRAAAQFVNRIDRLVCRLEYVTGLRDQIAACREANHPDPVGQQQQIALYAHGCPPAHVRECNLKESQRR